MDSILSIFHPLIHGKVDNDNYLTLHTTTEQYICTITNKPTIQQKAIQTTEIQPTTPFRFTYHKKKK